VTTRRNLQAVPAQDTPEPDRAPDLRDSVAEALKAMTWLGPSDKALCTLALRQAEEIESVLERAEHAAAILRDAEGDPSVYKRLKALETMCDATKTVGWLGPQLQGVLRDLGGTPAARKAMQPDKPVGGRLAQLRAGAAAAGVDDTED
jgi:hypothetical protein